MKPILSVILAVVAVGMLVVSGCSPSLDVPPQSTQVNNADATAETNDAEFDSALSEIEDLEKLNEQMESDYSTETWDNYLNE